MKATKPILLLGFLLLCYCLPAMAQSISSLCPNTALAPVFKQDFGQGANSGSTSKAAAGSTNYNFGGVGTDGNYIITPLVNNANKSDWTKGGDHTGNTNGNMFLVNAGGGNSIFFKQNVTGLCTGSSFNFSAWIANVNTSKTQNICGSGLVYPKVIFNIRDLSGNILGTITTGDLPLSPNNGPANWKKYGFQFSLPVGVTALTLEMVDFYGGDPACGNDLALDDIEFSACTPVATVTLSTASTLCTGANTSIRASLVNSPFITPAYQWQKSTDNGVSWTDIGTDNHSIDTLALKNLVPSDGGMYRMLVGPDSASLHSATCITASDTIILTVNPNPAVTLSNNGPLCAGTTLLLSSAVTGGLSPYVYGWTGPNAFSSVAASPAIASSTISATGKYLLTVTDANGCKVTDSNSVTVNANPVLTLSNHTQTICSGSNYSVTFNSTVSGTTYTWQSFLRSGAATGNTNNNSGTALNTLSNVLTNNSNTNAVISYVITATTAGGCVAIDSSLVTIVPQPSIAQAGADQFLCKSYSTVLNANIPVTGSGIWSQISGPALVNFFNKSDFNTGLFGMTTGTYAFAWTISNGICTASADTVSVTVFTDVTVANAGPDQTICLADSVTLNANTPVSGNGKWSFISGSTPVVFSDSSSATAKISGLNGGVYLLAWTISNGACADSKDTVQLTVLPLSGRANAGADQAICSGNATVLQANNPGSETGVWKQISGPSVASIADSSLYKTQVTGLVTGAYQFVWTISTASCGDTKDTVNISLVTTPPIANAGADQILCFTDSARLAAAIPSAGSGKWSLLSGPSSAAIADSSNANTAITGLTAGIYQFVWKISNTTCPDSQDTVSVSILPDITKSIAGNDQTLCLIDSVLLNGNTPVIGVGKWSLISGPSAVVFADSSKANTTVKGLVDGTYRLVWNISNSNCPDSKDTVNITILPAVTISNAGVDQTICFTDSAILNANTPVIGSGKWNFLSGPSVVVFTDSSKANTSIKGLIVGTYQLVWNISNGNCPDSKDTVSITILPAVTIANAGVDQTICLIDSASLNANAPVVGSGKWSLVSGPSAIVFSDSSKANTSIKGLIVGTYQLIWNISNGNCPDSKDTISITILPAVTIANAGTDQTLCLIDSATLNANTPVVGSGKWNFLSGPSAVVFTDSSKANTSIKGLVAGTYQLVWNISNNNCPDSKDTVSITILPAVTIANAGIDQNLCFTDSTTINANKPVIGSGKWSLISGPSAAVFTDSTKANTSIKGLIAGTYHLVWKISNSNCPDSKDTVSVTILPAVTITNAGTDQTLCLIDSATLNANTPAIGSGKWSLISGPSAAVFTDSSKANTSIKGLIAGTYQLVWKISNSNCPDSKDTVSITILPAVTIANAGADQTICLTDSTTLNANKPVIGSGKWSLITGPSAAVFTDSSKPNTTIKGLVAGTYQLVWNISNNNCPDSKDTVSITILPAVTIANAGTDQTLCLIDSVTLNANTPVIGSGKWSWISGPSAVVFTDSSKANTSIKGLVAGTYQLVWKITNHSCLASEDTLTIIVYPEITNLIDTVKKRVCAGQLVTINGQPVTGGNGISIYQWEKSYDGINWQTIPGANGINYSYTADTSIWLKRKLENNVCSNYSLSVFIRADKALSGNQISKDQEICYGDSVQTITGTLPTGGDGDYLYRWEKSIDSGKTWTIIDSAIQKDFRPGLVPVNTIFRRVVTTDDCQGAISINSNTVSILVRPLPKAEFQVSTRINCAPFQLDSITVKNITYSDRNGRYEWYINNTLSGNTIGFPGFILQADSAIIKLKAFSLYGCASDSASNTVSVYPIPHPAFTSSDTAGCGPLDIHFTNTTPSNPLFQYKWDMGNGQIIQKADPGTVRYPGSVSRLDTSYTVQLQVFTVCDTVSITKQIHVRAKPSAEMSVQVLNTCSPMNVLFHIKSSGVNSSNWVSFGDGADSSIQSIADFKHTYHTGNPASFPAKLLVKNECGADSVVTPLTALPNPVSVKMILKDTAVCGSPYTMVLNNQTLASKEFRWNWGDGSADLVSSLSGPVSHLYQQPGNYMISSTVSSGCSDSVVYRPLYIYPSVKAITNNILQNACIGETISFRSLSDSSLSSEWNFGNGIFSNTVADTFRYKSPGVYTPSLKVWSIHPQVSCYDSIKQTIEITAERKGQFSISDSLITCSPFRVKVKNLSTIPLQTEWNWGDGTMSYGDTASHQYLRNGRYLIRMHAVADGGCIYTDSASVSIQIPELQLQFKAGTYCTLNNPIVFTPSVNNTDSIRWNFGDGSIITAAPGKITHIYTSPGMYVPKLELLNTHSSCILPASASDTIRIDEIKADYTLSAVYDCGVTSYRFTDSSESYFPIDQRIWTLDQVQVSREKIHTQSFTRTGSHTSGLQVKTVYGCIADLQSKFSTTIYQYPAVNINAISQACLNNLMEMKSVVNSIDSVKSIYWNLGNGNNAIDSVVKVFYTVEGKYTVKLTVSTINSCYDSAYKIITIHPEPKITIAGDQILCKGDSLQLKANGAMKYIWKDQNDQVICSDCITASVKPLKNTQYKVIGYSEYGCSQIGSTNVRVIQPLKMIVKTPDSMCIGDTKKLLAAGAAQYNWLPDPTISNRTSPTPYVSPVTNTIYKVVGRDAFQCFNDTAEVKIVVGKPTPITIGRDTVILSGTPVQLHAVSSLQDIRKWQWAGNATFSCLTCPSPVAKVIFDECLSCTATNIYGCVSTDTVCIKTFCPTSEVFIPNAFSPDGDGINDLLVVQGRGLKLVKSFRVFNRWGEVVFEKTNFLPGDVSSGWDGKVRNKSASPDVYVYVCEVVCERGLPATFKGNVAILK